jgi:hypothetical protein
MRSIKKIILHIQTELFVGSQLIDVEIFEHNSSSSGRFDGEGK